MRVLLVWDNESESDLISMYLGVDGGEITVAVGAQQALEKTTVPGQYDVILFAINLPTTDEGFSFFKQIHLSDPATPMIGACQSQEVIRVARFMSKGMASYVIRDSARDYVFMLKGLVESTVEAVHAARDQKLAQKLREEVDSVRKLQESMVPKDIICPSGFRVVGRYEPAQIRVLGGQPVTMAGGDYYDVFTLPDNTLVLLVGDASGHGMKAAMSIMIMHTLVRMIRTKQYQDTAAFVSEINGQLSEQTIVNDEGGFITLLYAILSPDSGELQWTSAGHPPPMLQDFTNNEIRPLGDHSCGGLPLAVSSSAEYETYVSILPPDMRLALYTDGLEEAFPENRGGSHTQFGADGIKKVLHKTRSLAIEDVMQSLFDTSNAFTEGSGRHDDTSIVILERITNSSLVKK